MIHRRRMLAARNHGASPCRPWAAHVATGWSSARRPTSGRASPGRSGPSANAAATTRDTTTTTPWCPSLALVGRALALEWSALGLGPRKMAVVASGRAGPSRARGPLRRGVAGARVGQAAQMLTVWQPERRVRGHRGRESSRPLGVGAAKERVAVSFRSSRRAGSRAPASPRR